MSIEDEVRAMSERQHGAVGREQVRAYGGDRWWEAHRVGRGEWTLATDRVLVLRGSPDTSFRRVTVGLLDAGLGMTLSHHTAAWLWGLPRFAPTPVHVTALRDVYRRSSIAVIHEPRRLFPAHVTEVEGFPVTSITRTVFDLAATLPPGRVKRLVHHAVRRHPGLLPVFHRTLDELAVRGRAGIVAMREILDALPIGSVPADSGTELRFEEILASAGEPVPRRQVSLGGQEFLGIIDYVDDELGLLFEIDSRTFHLLLPEDRTRDAQRDAAGNTLGLRTVRIPDTLIWRDPDEVVRIVRSERRARRAQLLVVEP